MKSLMVLATLAAAAAPLSDDSSAILGRAVGASLQGDAKSALEILRPIDVSSLDPKDQAFVICMRERFGSSEKQSLVPSHDLAGRAASVYRSYWHSSLLHPSERGAAEERLRVHLRRLLKAPAKSDMDALETSLEKALAARGHYSLEGQTGVLHEFMDWTKETKKTLNVSLPEGVERVKVVFLAGFKSLGWGDYSTCGRRGAGGWATKDTLFAVVPRYESLDGEEFKVTFLGHESQHFADFRKFGQLEPWRMEYRAKLVELAEVDVTRAKVLRKFIEDQGSDPKSPHSFANRRVLGEMAGRLGQASTAQLFDIELSKLHSAAVAALNEDTRQLQAARQ